MTSHSPPRHIAVIGEGNVGAALGQAWRAAGHRVRYGVRDPSGPERASLSEAAESAEIVVLAVPWSAALDVVGTLGDLSGKIVIDCTNPLAMRAGGLGLALGFAESGAERIAAAAAGAAVFKTLNQTGAENLAQARAFPRPPAMFVAGDAQPRKPEVMALVADIGFEPIDAGPLFNARLLEPLAMLWIDQSMARGAGRAFALSLTRRPS